MPNEVILCGGGALNPFLHERISAALQPHGSRVTTSKDHGWAPHTIEAAAFALLAWLRWKRRPGNLPQTTGASGPRLLGQILET
jgi:anhydro-N-acetylmuramic acid kinase